MPLHSQSVQGPRQGIVLAQARCRGVALPPPRGTSRGSVTVSTSWLVAAAAWIASARSASSPTATTMAAESGCNAFMPHSLKHPCNRSEGSPVALWITRDKSPCGPDLVATSTKNLWITSYHMALDIGDGPCIGGCAHGPSVTRPRGVSRGRPHSISGPCTHYYDMFATQPQQLTAVFQRPWR